MINKTLISVVSKSAPILGAALNSVLPGSGLILNGLAAIFGAKSSDQEGLAQKIAADPESTLKLVQFQMDHESDLEKIGAGDRDSARRREESIVQSTGKRDWVQDFIAIFLLVLFSGVIFCVFFTKLDKTDHDILYLLAGQLSGAFFMVVTYYFGGMLMKSKPIETQLLANLPQANSNS